MAQNKLYVGNLPFSCNEDTLRDLCSSHGNVQSAKVITDRATGQSKGFGFVEFSSDSEAQTAVDKLNGADMGGRALKVSIAREEDRSSGGGGGRGGYGGGGGGGYGGGGGGRRSSY